MFTASWASLITEFPWEIVFPLSEFQSYLYCFQNESIIDFLLPESLTIASWALRTLCSTLIMLSNIFRLNFTCNSQKLLLRKIIITFLLYCMKINCLLKFPIYESKVQTFVSDFPCKAIKN